MSDPLDFIAFGHAELPPESLREGFVYGVPFAWLFSLLVFP